MQRHGVPIDSYPLRNRGKNPGISYSDKFLEWEAGTAAGLDMWLWDTGIYSNKFKAKTLAWYELHIAVKNHIADANYVKPKKGRG